MQVRDIYVTPSIAMTDQRNHRPDRVRATRGRRKKTRVEEPNLVAPVPGIIMTRRAGKGLPHEYQWKFDPDSQDSSVDGVWQTSEEVNKELVVQYLESAVHFHSEHRYVETRRVSIGSLTEVQYQTRTTKGQATMLAELFLHSSKRLKVVQIGEPTVRLNARGGHSGVLDRSYTVQAARGVHRVIFGHVNSNQVGEQRISCTCYPWRSLMTRVARTSSVKLCACLCTMLIRAGFPPGHAFYVQAGFTSEEIDTILTHLGNHVTTIDRMELGELDYGQWMVIPGTGRKATCAASESRRGCATSKTTKEVQPILSKDGPRVVAMGKRLVNNKWVPHKFQYCLTHKCSAAVLPTRYCDVPPPPTDLILAPGLVLTKEQNMSAGALTFRTQ